MIRSPVLRAIGVTMGVAFLSPPAPSHASVPPASVADTLLTTVQLAGSSALVTYYHLGADGVARKLFGRSFGPATNYNYVYTPSEQFDYTYEVVPGSANLEAILTFAGGAMTPDFVHRLYFAAANPNAGTLDSPTATSSFHLATRSASTGAVNVSNRLWLHPGETNITGFVLDQPQWIVIRGVGPSLAKMGVPVVTADPAIQVYVDQSLAATNDQWGANGPDAQAMAWIFELVGAFPLNAGAADAALFFEASAGPHTVHATDATATLPAEVLVEMYLFPYQ